MQKLKAIRKSVIGILVIVFFIGQSIFAAEYTTSKEGVGFTFDPSEIREIESVIKSCGSGVSVYYQDIVSEYTYGYNIDQKYFIASVIKAPYCMYIYQLASEGKCDLNKRYTYSSRHKWDGTGKIQYMKIGTTFSLQELISYAIKYSDNVAMQMLKEAFPVAGYKEYAKTLNLTYLEDIKNGTNGNLTARDAGAYIKAINQFIHNNPYGKEFKSLMSSTSNHLITTNYPAMRKYGWAQQSFHEIAIIEAPRPYLLCILTNHENGDMNTFRKISNVIEKYAQKQGYPIANPSPYQMFLNEVSLPLTVYEIEGTTYVSIREVEALLQGTQSAFEINVEPNRNVINITTEEKEGLMDRFNVFSKKTPIIDEKVEAIKNDMHIYWNKFEVCHESYLIKGVTYIKLRELSQLLSAKLACNDEEKKIYLKI